MVGYCERREDAALLKAAALEAAARLDLPAWQAELLFSLTLFLQRLEGESEADIWLRGCDAQRGHPGSGDGQTTIA